ncbi:MAG: hypothetical protein H8E72_08100 [Candidatus Marinimicrobia bacterium]|nr:hypothetical protein [Candidatus Neomarinimicrobiota bacterium]
MKNSPKDIISIYYNSWVINDKSSAREQLADDLIFRSPNDNFDSADSFMDACWQFSEYFTEFKLLHQVYEEKKAYIIYPMDKIFIGEFIKFKDGKISEIYVSFNPTL